MADSKNIIKLDAKLIESGLVDENFASDFKKVHSFLNSHVRKNGKILTEETFSKGDAELRQWLMLLYKKGASQEKLTSYLRIGLAHLCFDFIESTYKQISLDDLIARTLVSFKNRKFHKTFFKVAVTEAASSVRGKKEAKLKAKEEKAASKKKSVKKSSLKKSKAKSDTKKSKSTKSKSNSKTSKPPKKSKSTKKVEKKEEKKGFFSFFSKK
ncbi:MAG: hypothetical protein JJT78_14440 [Leptospira sp.]|nr:hypothetical protein [Leptospira sp.]